MTNRCSWQPLEDELTADIAVSENVAGNVCLRSLTEGGMRAIQSHYHSYRHGDSLVLTMDPELFLDDIPDTITFYFSQTPKNSLH